jgi:hypothetical protein
VRDRSGGAEKMEFFVEESIQILQVTASSLVLPQYRIQDEK